jgi:DNA-binding transcriptional regulator PaaX
MKLKLSGRDIVLITLALALGGAGTAHVITSLVKTQLKKQYREAYTRTFKAKTFYATLSRLKSQGLLSHEKRGIWRITKQGKAFAEKISRYLDYESWKREKTDSRVLIIFDIPELQRKKRDYLRLELRYLDFEPLQKSVWIGKRPLPPAFIAYLRDMNLLSHVHILAIQKKGTLSHAAFS